MIYWILIYASTARGMKKEADKLTGMQLSEMDGMFRSACQGMDSPDMRKIYEQHRRKTLFYHTSADTGLRYRFDINRRKGTVTILSVEADYDRLIGADHGSHGTVAA